jgi:hypothetical protein
VTGKNDPVPREVLRLRVFKFAARLSAANRNVKDIAEIADKIWDWVEGGKVPVSRTQARVANAVSRIVSESKPEN